MAHNQSNTDIQKEKHKSNYNKKQAGYTKQGIKNIGSQGGYKC